MPTRDEMNALGREIVGAYEARTAGIARVKESEAGRKRTAVQEIAQRSSDVSAMLKEFREEQAGVRDEWEKLSATMQAKRGGVALVVEAPRPVEVLPPPAVVAEAPRPVVVVAPPPAVVAEAPPAMAEEEAVAMAEVGEVTPELASLSERVFEYLANHPDGTRLIELEREFSMSRLQMARVVRNLMDEGKAEKRDLFYFAA